MADSVLDFAALDSAAATTEPAAAAEPVVETPAAEPAAGAEPAAEPEAELNADGTPKEKSAADLPGTEATPHNVRQALKALRDTDPKNASVVKELHGAYERWAAAKAVFPKGVAEMQEAKEFIETVGGHEGFEKMRDTVAAIEASDTLLYAGDAQLTAQIVEDLKGQGKLDALGKIAPSFLDAVKENDPKGYAAAIAPHFLSGLQSAEVPQVFDAVTASLAKGTPEGYAEAKRIIDGASAWYKNLQSQAEKAKTDAVNPDRLKLEEDRKTFLKEQEAFKTNQTQEFKNGVAKESQSGDNRTLGKHLGVFLKAPYFKEFSRDSLQPLAREIQNSLWGTLKADKNYQAQMAALWGAKSPDKAKLLEYHRQKVDSISERIVRSAVQTMYPGYAKGGTAVARVAAVAGKKATDAKVTAQSIATGKPVYVAQKPSWDALDMEHKDKNGKPDAQLLFIAGKGYMKGSNRFVTWRK